MKRFYLFSLFVFLMFGCNSTSDQGSTFTLKTKVNESKSLESNLTIEVKSVNDSRCPRGCNCFWAGEVKVFIHLSEYQNSMDTCLILPSHSTIRFRDYSVELKDVSPYPICDNHFPSDYVFTFLVNNLR